MKHRIVPAVLYAFLILPLMTYAQERGAIGIGFTNTSAPFGIRWWFAKNVGIDFNIGGNISENQSTSSFENHKKSSTTLAFECGIPIISEKIDKASIVIRPGVHYEYYSTGLINHRVEFKLSIGTEFFLTERLSIDAASGVFYASTETTVLSRSGRNYMPFGRRFIYDEENLNSYGTFCSLGFHFYFKK